MPVLKERAANIRPTDMDINVKVKIPSIRMNGSMIVMIGEPSNPLRVI